MALAVSPSRSRRKRPSRKALPEAPPVATAMLSPNGPTWRRPVASLSMLSLGATLAFGALGGEGSAALGMFITGSLAAAVGTCCLLDSDIVRTDGNGCSNVRRVALGLALAAAALVLITWILRREVAGTVFGHPALSAIGLSLVLLWLVHSCAVTVASMVEGAEINAHPNLAVAKRPGFWLIAIATMLYLPLLGNFGLIDPWESHYAEVTREMLARRDWISLWWGEEGWFWSKPILNFWMQGLSFLWLNVNYLPDQVLPATAGGVTHPEWAVRMPNFLWSLLGLYLLYKGTAGYVGRRKAFLGGLVLCTTPYWYFLARQSMADMAYVGPLCASMGLLLLGLRADPESRARAYDLALGTRTIRLSGFHLLICGVCLLVFPQVIYLFSRNVSLDTSAFPYALEIHRDRVIAGSFQNCGLPGNAPCGPDLARVAIQPIWTAAGAAAAAVAFFWHKRKERRAKSLCYLGAWLFLALSFMSKGPPGPVIIISVLVSFLFVSTRTSELRRCEPIGLLLLFLSVAMPWFVQEYARHGRPFFDELFVKDMFDRAFSKVHDTNAASGDDTSFRYYVWQLGYGLFPWTGLIAAANLWFLGYAFAPTSEADPLKTLTRFMILWELAAFGMLTISGTKYHHYIFPMVPAAAVLGGCFVDELIGTWRKEGSEPQQDGSQIPIATRASTVGALCLAAAALTALVGRDLAVDQEHDFDGSIRLLHLFTYLYTRSWPSALSFEVPLSTFAGAATLCCIACIAPRWRRYGALGSISTAVVSAAWALNVYLQRVSPHWSQRATVAEYYRRRAGANELLVAYRMNWKGENFYTGNRVPTFQKSGLPFTSWLGRERAEGTQVMYFTTEHSSVAALKEEIGEFQGFDLVTDATTNNKLVLVRVTL